MVEDWSVEKVSASTAIERGSVGFESTDKVQRVTKAASKKQNSEYLDSKKERVRAGLTNKQTAPKFCAHGVLLGPASLRKRNGCCVAKIERKQESGGVVGLWCV